jgi:hypothetical protein
MLGKMKGYLARFAGLLHCIEWTQVCAKNSLAQIKALPEEISTETLLKAAELCVYYIGQYRLVMSEAGATGLPDWVTRLERKARDSKLDRINASKICQWHLAAGANEASKRITQLVNEYRLGDKEEGRQGGLVWLPNAVNPHRQADDEAPKDE